MTPLTVYITVDTEFSVGNAFREPLTGKPAGPESVYCRVNGRSQGLGFLLDTLAANGLSATFFIEALNTTWFGDDPMGRIARELVKAGQDVQLHLHPFWLYFQHSNWRQRLAITPPVDRTSGRSTSSLTGLITMGIEAFQRWDVPRPSAFRCGGLDVDENVYRALNLCDLRLASNIGLGLIEPPEQSLHQVGGAHLFHGVVELPILTYNVSGLGNRVQRKILTITGSSWSETRTLLWKAHGAGYQQVVLLTHPFEFVKTGRRSNTLHVNRINQSRFIRLCEFIRKFHDDFRTGVMQDVDRETLNFGPVPKLKVSLLQATTRIVINRLNDSVMKL